MPDSGVLNSSHKRDIGADLLLTGCLLLVHPFLIFLIGNLSLIAGRPLCSCYFFAASLITFPAGLILCKRIIGRCDFRKTLLISAGVVSAPLLIGLPASKIYDYSVDGQTYHLEMVLQLADGWVPGKEERGVLGPLSAYMNHFPAGDAVIRGVDYMLTGRVESSKAFNLTILLSSFLIVSGGLLRYSTRLNWIQILALSFTAAYNPVSVSQLPSFYIDGILSSLLVILFFILLMPEEMDVFVQRVILLPVLCLLAGSKFTGLVFAILIPTLILCGRCYFSRPFPIRSHCLYLCIAWVVMLMACFHPYLTGIRDHNHPFYPLAGPDAVDMTTIMEENRPANFNSMNRFQRLFHSIYSEMGQQSTSTTDQPSRLKCPFTFNYQNVRKITATADIRVAGWGPYFGLALIACFLIFAVSLFQNQLLAMLFLSINGMIFITGIINGEAWWARFTPHFWLIPIITCALIWQGTSSRILRSLANFCILICVINVLILGSLRCTATWRVNNRIIRQIEMIRNLPQPVRVVYGFIRSTRIRFAEAGIMTFELPKEENLGEGEWANAFTGSDAKIFIPHVDANGTIIQKK